MTHICVGNLTIIGPDNGLSPGRRQAIIWTNAGILLIGPRGTNFSEILIGIHTFSFKKIHLKMSSAKWRPFFLGLNVLTFRGPCSKWLPNTWSHSFTTNIVLLSASRVILAHAPSTRGGMKFYHASRRIGWQNMVLLFVNPLWHSYAICHGT